MQVNLNKKYHSNSYHIGVVVKQIKGLKNQNAEYQTGLGSSTVLVLGT